MAAFGLFVRMCAARVGQLLNLSALAADCGISTNTAKGWLSILEAGYLVFTLQPHHVNFGKQLTKSPKLYFHDTGLAAWLVGLRSGAALGLSAMRGALFENWAVSETLKHSYNHRLGLQLNFWRNKSGVEIDLLIEHAQSLHAVELKSGQTVAADWFKGLKKYAALHAEHETSSSPSLTQTVVYGGTAQHSRPGVSVMGWRDWASHLNELYPAPDDEAAAETQKEKPKGNK
jgi:predicted AAA+ superfamily ATPase